MKKAVVCLSLIVLLLNGMAFADESFTLHNGLKFGMTEEEAYNTEKAAGVNLIDDGIFYTWTGSIAGQENTKLSLGFGSEGNAYSPVGLNYMSYYFDSIDTYRIINDSLIAKYGHTRFTSETGGFLVEPTLNKQEIVPYGWVDTVRNAQYSQWLIPYNDTQSILIKHACYENEKIYYDELRELMIAKGYNANDFEDFLRVRHFVQYDLLTEEETKEYNQKANQYLNDL